MKTFKSSYLAERFSLEILRQELSRHGAYVWVGIFILPLIIFMAVTNSIASKREGLLAQKEAEQDGFYEMVGEYKREMASIGYLREKLHLSGVEGSTGTVIEEIAARIGINKKITSFKPLAEGLVNGYMEKGVQVEIEGITLNQAVNLLYKINGYKNLLLIRDFSMKNHFQNPDKLDITLQVILITKPTGTL
jgi:general secretion pathway protein M